MGTRQKLADTAKYEAQRFFHGDVMQTKDNLSPILELFPALGIDEADGKWCAAFAYYSV